MHLIRSHSRSHLMILFRQKALLFYNSNGTLLPLPLLAKGKRGSCPSCPPPVPASLLITGKNNLIDVAVDFQSLPFSVATHSKYACRACVQKLKKRRAILTTLNVIEVYFCNSACKKSTDLATIEDQEPTATVSKRICNEATEV